MMARKHRGMWRAQVLHCGTEFSVSFFGLVDATEDIVQGGHAQEIHDLCMIIRSMCRALRVWHNRSSGRQSHCVAMTEHQHGACLAQQI